MPRKVFLEHPDTKERLCITDWSKKLGCSVSTIRDRRKRYAKDLRKVLSPTYLNGDTTLNIVELREISKKATEEIKLWKELSELKEGYTATRTKIIALEQKLGVPSGISQKEKKEFSNHISYLS
jgi:hypothetical protein